MLAYPRCAVGPLPLHLGHHYPAVRWTNKALGRCEGATQLCKHLTSQQDSAASATLVVCVLCTGNQPQSVIKSSCFPPCRLTGRPSCDTIWTSNYSTDGRRRRASFFVHLIFMQQMQSFFYPSPFSNCIIGTRSLFIESYHLLPQFVFFFCPFPLSLEKII